MQASRVLSLSPSFNNYSSSRLTEIAARVVEEFRVESESNDDLFYYHTEEESPPLQTPSTVKLQEEQPEIEEDKEDDEEEEEEDDDFEFSFVCREPEMSPITADEIFYKGQIKPIYPIFNTDLLLGSEGRDDGVSMPETKHRLPLRKLMTEERDRDPPSCSSSEADEIEGLPPGTYCVWKPKAAESPGQCKKSNSTGSSKRWKFRDLLHRSNSDGKDTYVFLSPSASASTKTKKKDEKVENEVSSSDDGGKVAGKVKSNGVTGSELYVRNRVTKEGDRRRSYLPYRQDLVGFFSNANGLSKNLHPF